MCRMRSMPDSAHLPYPASVLRGVIPAKGATICQIIVAWFRYARMSYSNWKWLYGSDGVLTDTAKTSLCTDFKAIGGCNPNLP